MHSSNSDFFFGLLRVSVAQLLASRGFDRSKASTVDTLADLHVRFLGLLVQEVRSLAAARCSGDDGGIALQDLTLAMANLGLLKPCDALDVYGENPQADSGLEALQQFRQWCTEQQVGFDLGEVVPVHLAETQRLADAQEQRSAQVLQTQGGPGGVFALPQANNDATATEESAAKVADEEQRRDALLRQMADDGEARDWLALQVGRQRVQIYNRRYTREVAMAMAEDPGAADDDSAGLPSSVPEFAALPAVPGLRYSALRNTCTSSGSGVVPSSSSTSGAPLDNDTKLQNETVPSVAVPLSNTSDNAANHDDNIDDERAEEQRRNAALWQDKAARLTQLLPAMTPATRLDNITLSYEQSDDDDMQSDAMQSDDENAIEETDMPLAAMDTDNINFDEFGDMDDTFQRRASLDYGQQMF